MRFNTNLEKNNCQILSENYKFVGKQVNARICATSESLTTMGIIRNYVQEYKF